MLKYLFPHLKPVDVSSEQGRDGWLHPKAGSQLLDTPYRQSLIKAMWDMTSLTRAVFDEYLLQPLERYAELVQRLPASESHHHAYQGGMLDHGLEIACYALRLRRQYLLPPGAKPEEQTVAGELWNIAIVYAALLHDVGKTLVDVDVVLKDGCTYRLQISFARAFRGHSVRTPTRGRWS